MIKDYDYPLKFVENGLQNVKTDNINGSLKAIIISSSRASQIEISFDKLSGITLYKHPDVVGTHYIPLKVESQKTQENKYNFAPDYYYLNNALLLSVRGLAKSTVNITLRVEVDA